MGITITDDIYDEAERLLRLPAEQWGSHLRDMRALLRGRMAEPKFVPEQHARAQALIVRVTAVLRDGGDHRQGLDARTKMLALWMPGTDQPFSTLHSEWGHSMSDSTPVYRNKQVIFQKAASELIVAATTTACWWSMAGRSASSLTT